MVSMRGMARRTIYYLQFDDINERHDNIYGRHGKIYDLISMICWYLYEAWQGERFIVYDLLVSV